MKKNKTIESVSLILFLIFTILPVRSQCNYFTKIATSSTDGSFHTLAIKDNGSLWAWGSNTFGQLGDNTTIQRSIAVQIGTRTDWATIAVGKEHSLGITSDGKLWAWGRNIDGSLADFTNTQRNSPIQVGTATNWVSISAGYQCSLGITTDGKLWGWGNNAAGQLGNGATANVYYPEQIGTATNWVAVKIAQFSSFGITSDGKLWSWGANNYGQLGDGTTTQRNFPTQVGTATNWVAISPGLFHCLGITSDGKLWSWGYNSGGQLGDNSLINILVPTQIGTATNWATVSAGRYYSSAISNDGKFWAWGYDGTCQMANNNYQYVLTPTQILGGDTNWESINASHGSFYNIKSDATNIAWGFNGYGQIGDGTVGGPHICAPIQIGTIPIYSGLATSGSTATMIQNAYNMYKTSCSLIASVSQRVAALHPIRGNTTAKVWVETIQPLSFVKRHYQIMPTTNASIASGKVTLYFTQNEFDDYNAVNSGTLPTNATDVTGKASLIIEKFSGSSSDATGLPSTYAGASEIINPVDSDVIWNATENRWEVSFITTGFGGFFVGATPPTEVILKLFLEGYYDVNNHAMVPVKLNQGVGSSTTYVDDITVELRNATTGAFVASVLVQLQTNGTALATFPSSPTGMYYIVIKHRNTIQTWSATPQSLGAAVATYDFSDSSNKVYGDNTKQMEPGVYALYTGDINQDELIDPLDYSIWEANSDAFAFGYLAADLNGDGVVDPLDYSLWEVNSNNFIFASYPTF